MHFSVKYQNVNRYIEKIKEVFRLCEKFGYFFFFLKIRNCKEHKNFLLAYVNEKFIFNFLLAYAIIKL